MPNRSLTIGVDARDATESPAGGGRVARELLAALGERDDPHRYVLYCRQPGDVRGLDERFTWESISLPDPAWHLRAALAANAACDVFLSTNSYLTAWFLRIPCALVVYDLIAFMPGVHARGRAKRIERATLGPALRRARAAVCISEATRRDLVARFPRADAIATVVRLAAAEHFDRARSEGDLAAVRSRLGLPGSFVLSVGTLEPRKNLDRLVAAHGSLPAEVRAANPLVLAGPPGWKIDGHRLAAGTEGVRLLGYVSDDDLAALYTLCTVFCFPSLYEGFGLPVLEAMLSGAPTITSRVASLPEVGGDAVEYANPHSVTDIAAALRGLLDSPDRRAELGRRGRERAREFSWQRTATEVLAVLEGMA